MVGVELVDMVCVGMVFVSVKWVCMGCGSELEWHEFAVDGGLIGFVLFRVDMVWVGLVWA